MICVELTSLEAQNQSEFKNGVVAFLLGLEKTFDVIVHISLRYCPSLYK